jgi:hypothetical protein
MSPSLLDEDEQEKIEVLFWGTEVHKGGDGLKYCFDALTD